jgi:hypothetical protein
VSVHLTSKPHECQICRLALRYFARRPKMLNPSCRTKSKCFSSKFGILPFLPFPYQRLPDPIDAQSLRAYITRVDSINARATTAWSGAARRRRSDMLVLGDPVVSVGATSFKTWARCRRSHRGGCRRTSFTVPLLRPLTNPRSSRRFPVQRFDQHLGLQFSAAPARRNRHPRFKHRVRRA